MSNPAALQSSVMRILDANLDRSREGLRIIEEWCRFGLNNSDLAQECKNLRQEIAQLHTSDIRAARNTSQDVGTQLSHPQEEQRQSLEQLLVVNFSRTQEALRVLEEYGKLQAGDLSSRCKQLRYRVYQLESALTQPTIDRHSLLRAAKLYLVTMPVPNLLGVVDRALQGGVTIVQYRDKDGHETERWRMAHELRKLCQRHQALFIVNDRLDLALAVDADGVHLGQTDAPIALARQLLGPDKIIGRSTTNPQELAVAIQEGADYIGVGPVYETPTKPGKAAAGLDYVRFAAQKASLPWFAIGGIDRQNLDEVVGNGAPAVAVVRAICQSEQPNLAANLLLNTILQGKAPSTDRGSSSPAPVTPPVTEEAKPQNAPRGPELPRRTAIPLRP